MDSSRWYQLDNIGKFYSYQGGDPGQTVFRVAAEINTPVDPAALQEALNEAIARYPGFNVALRNGVFWHYLEQLSTTPAIQEERTPICCGFFEGSQYPLFRVTYFKNRINIEMSHILSDGRGTIEFMKALLAAYFSKGAFKTNKPYSCALPEGTAAKLNENWMEDSFRANYDKASAKTTKLPKAYHLRGWKNAAAPTFFEYHLSASQVCAQAKEFHVSVTSLIIAAVIKACQETMPAHTKTDTVSLDVPVDLRRFYNSTTVRNFFGLAYVHFDKQQKDSKSDPLITIAQAIHEQLCQATDPEELKGRMNAMVKLEKNPILRMAPLFLKDLILELASNITARDVTTTVSNVGVIDLPPYLAEHVQSFSMLTATKGLNFTACTVHDDLCVGISSAFIRHDVIRNFCRIFSHLGIYGYLNLNKDNNEVIESLRLGVLERPLEKPTNAKALNDKTYLKVEGE